MSYFVFTGGGQYDDLAAKCWMLYIVASSNITDHRTAWSSVNRSRRVCQQQDSQGQNPIAQRRIDRHSFRILFVSFQVSLFPSETHVRQPRTPAAWGGGRHAVYDSEIATHHGFTSGSGASIFVIDVFCFEKDLISPEPLSILDLPDMFT